MGGAASEGKITLANQHGYKAIKELSKGECGVAWLARGPDGTKVCVKVSRHRKKGKKEGQEQRDLKKEAEALKELEAAEIDGVTQCFQLFESDDGKDVEMVMDFVENALELQDCRANQFTFQEGCKILGDVALTLSNAHENNITHKDLHAGNIMIGFNDRFHSKGIREVEVIDWSRKADGRKGNVLKDGGQFMGILQLLFIGKRMVQKPTDAKQLAQYNELMAVAQGSALRRSNKGCDQIELFATGYYDNNEETIFIYE